jgi:hypothetical protein
MNGLSNGQIMVENDKFAELGKNKAKNAVR